MGGVNVRSFAYLAVKSDEVIIDLQLEPSATTSFLRTNLLTDQKTCYRDYRAPISNQRNYNVG